ncbi:sialate O-acetylesterase [Algibacter mikhailovii]|uniref:sialate O-acetylesterase n=1 Tax=Algibacter mikhailovii TaxID=425498 RepID=UPI0024946A6C|nr:sialate O-acetylesterase [Algibacter mikhailovii]
MKNSLKTAITVLFLFGVSLPILCQKKTNNVVQVVLMAGQSNMAGGGNYDNLDDETKGRVANVSNRVSLSFNGKPAKPLSYYNNKPSEKYNFDKRFGPELLMGVTLAEANPNQEFLLIKRSQGGTALYGAWNPNWTSEKAKEVETKEFKQKLKLYELHVSDIKRNLEALKKQDKSYEIIGLAWMQGENDATLDIAAKQYKNNLKNLVSAYRSEFNVKDMPFVLGQINSRYGVQGGAEMVREKMFQFAYQDYYSKLIETSTDSSWSDFPKHPDNVHYNAEGQKRLGVAFANAFFDIQKKLDVNEFQNTSQLIPAETIKFRAKGVTNMMYHVYTPTNFSVSQKLPIIIAFSPQGKGDGILAHMKLSAEKMGWILVGVDKLKNGMKDKRLEQKMEDEVMDDILKNIPHDSQRIYLAGFSGGAMRAYGLSTRRLEKYEGIIAYGGWLGGDDYQDKSYQKGMRVAIINGEKDKGANKWKAIDAKTLIKNKCQVKYFNHSGGHSIAPNDITTEALHWLETEYKQ